MNIHPKSPPPKRPILSTSPTLSSHHPISLTLRPTQPTYIVPSILGMLPYPPIRLRPNTSTHSCPTAPSTPTLRHLYIMVLQDRYGALSEPPPMQVLRGLGEDTVCPL